MSPEAGNEGLDGLQVAQAGLFDKAGEVRRAKTLERKEALCNMDVNWDDEYILEFAQAYPDVMKQHMDEVRKVACMNKSSAEYISAKVDLFDHVIGNLQWRIKAEHLNQQFLQASLKSFSGTPVERKGISEKLTGSFHKTDDYEFFKGNLVLMKKAYERFLTDMVEVEKYLSRGIASGEVKVSEGLPYVMYVNKDPNKQYLVIYKYDKRTKKLSFKACNIVSTGDQVRWLEEEPGRGHTTPTRVFYIGETKGLKHSSLDGKGGVYGQEFVDKDREPYQMFRLYLKKDGSYEYTGYLVHPTWEEPLLGQTASHGCIRVPRIMDLQLVRIYDEWYKAQGITDFKKFPPDKQRHPSVKVPVVVRGI